MKRYMTSKSALQVILKGILYTEDKDKNNHEWMGIIKFHEMSR
jgi:hypothetical protein